MKKFLLGFVFLFSTAFAGGADFEIFNIDTGNEFHTQTLVNEKFSLVTEIKDLIPEIRGNHNISCKLFEKREYDNIFECMAPEAGEFEIFFEVQDEGKIKKSNNMRVSVSDEKFPIKIDHVFFDKNEQKIIAPIFNLSGNILDVLPNVVCEDMNLALKNIKIEANNWNEIFAMIDNFSEIEQKMLQDKIFSCKISIDNNLAQTKEFDFRFAKYHKNFETLNFRNEGEPRNFPLEEMRKEKIFCVDDDGKNIFNKNVTKIFDQNNFVIREHEDFCLGPKLQEFYCDENDLENYEDIFCENGCQDGACKKEFTPPADFEKEIRAKNMHESPFFDIDEKHPFGVSAIHAFWNGIAGGYKIKNYEKPAFFSDKLINRAEAVKFILLATNTEIDLTKKYKKDYPEELWFHDLFEGEWYVPFVMKAAEKGIANGYYINGLRVFGPDEPLDGAQFSKMLVEGFEFSIPEKFYEKSNEWYEIYFWTLEEKNIDFAKIDPGKQINRGESIHAIYQLLEQ